MKRRIISLFILIMIIFSCRKSNYIPPVIPIVPVVPDSLFGWKEIGHIRYAEDIWFTSPSEGIVLGDAIYQTTDSGKTWKAVANNYPSFLFFNLFFVSAQVGFAQSSSQMALTVDGGHTWAIKSLPTTGGATMFFVNPSTGFYGDANGQGLYKTTDSANSWVSIFNDMKVPEDYYPYFLNADTGYVATGSGIFASTVDGGQNWQTKTNLLPANHFPGAYNQLLFLDGNKGFYAWTFGILKTTDGGSTWNNVLSILSNGIGVIKFVNTDLGFYLGGSVIYKTTDGGQSWAVSCKLGSDEFEGIHFIDAHTGWACTFGGRIFRLQQ